MMREQNYLLHYGISGQKWGVRRYQNPDGTLTEEGKARYNGAEQDTSESNTSYNANTMLHPFTALKEAIWGVRS